MQTLLSTAAFAITATIAPQAQAQENLVGVCSGVSLPRSVVTDITGKILAPVLAPVETLLGRLTFGTVDLDLSTALTNAANGVPISLGVLDINGNAVDLATTPRCVSQADGFTLATPAGLAFGGNRISGLGTAGRFASAAELNAIALGDLANTGAGATGAVAIGDSASVTAVGALGSVALGQNSVANGATLGNAAYLTGGAAAAEVNIGDRRLTGLASGAEDTDAVTVGQLKAAAALGLGPVDALNYDAGLGAYSALRSGTVTRITNVAPAALTTTSSDAVNGAQVFGLGSSVAAALGGASSFDPATGQVTAGITYGGTTYGSIQGAVSAIETSNGTGTRYFNATSVMADSRATGTDSTAVGPNAVASADGAIAAGRNTVAGSAGSVAIGDGSSTTSGKAVSIGSANVASGNGAVAIGDPNIATGDGAVALGRDNQATGTGAVALGDTNFATGDGAVALGQTNQASGVGAIAIGGTNLVNGANAVAVGSNNVVTGVEALAFGIGNQAIGDGALAIGANIMTSGTDTLAVGNDTMAVGDSSAAYGNRAAATGLRSTALGTDATANQQLALAVGQQSIASGAAATAVGSLSQASGFASAALGAGAIASLDNSVALGAAASTTRGGVASYAAFGVTGAQSSAGEIAVGRTVQYFDPITGTPDPLGDRQITGVAAGSVDTDAVNVAQLRGVSTTLGTAVTNSLGGGSTYDLATGEVTGPTYVINGTTYTNVGDALAGVSGAVGQVSNAAVTYDTGVKDLVTLAGATGTTITNVAAASLTATSTDAVNGSQLFATNQQVGANTAAITTLTTNIANGTADPLAVRYTDTTKGTLALGGATGTVVTNVAAGAVTATSTDAVNGAQLARVDTRVTDLGTSVAGSLGGGSVTNVDGSITAPSYQVTNVAAGGATTTNTYGDVGSALSGLGTSISNVNTRIDTINTVSDRAVTYDGASGTARDTITLAGAAGTRISNVTAGAVNATSTDAVNGAQLDAVGQQVAGNTTSITNLQNGTAGFFQVNNTAGNPTPVASGSNAIAAGGAAVSSGAGAVALGTGATASGTNSVALGAGSIADRADSVSVGNATTTRQVTNVAAGTMATDAVNLGQLSTGLNQTLASANAYTDARLNQVGFDLRDVRRDANGGTAAAMALATIPQAYGPGMGMVGGGVSTWGGQQAFAIGVSKATADGGMILKAGATINTRGKGGGSAGVGFAF